MDLVNDIRLSMEHFSDLCKVVSNWLLKISLILLVLGIFAIAFFETVLLERLVIGDYILLYIMFYIYLLIPSVVTMLFGIGALMLSKKVRKYSYEFHPTHKK